MPVADFITASDLVSFKSGDPDKIVKQVQGAIRAFCGWHVTPLITDAEIVLDGRGGRHLWLPSLNVVALSDIVNEETVLTSDDYDWSTDGYVELRSGFWTTRPRQISIKFTHGFPNVPDELIGLGAEIAARATSAPTGDVREQAGQVSVQHGTINGVAGGIALLEHEKEILGKYKLPPRF